MTGTAAIVALLALWLLGIHLVGEWTLAERVRRVKRWFVWLWCSLRDHPYPKNAAVVSEDDDPTQWPPANCSNCGAVMSGRRGMHS